MPLFGTVMFGPTLFILVFLAVWLGELDRNDLG